MNCDCPHLNDRQTCNECALIVELDRLREALRQCASLTRNQEQSPATVREVGRRVAAIVTGALGGEWQLPPRSSLSLGAPETYEAALEELSQANKARLDLTRTALEMRDALRALLAGIEESGKSIPCDGDPCRFCASITAARVVLVKAALKEHK
jgi:hypothetical protein